MVTGENESGGNKNPLNANLQFLFVFMFSNCSFFLFDDNFND